MLTPVLKKYIKSLHDKRNRLEEWRFLVEWWKPLVELLQSNHPIEYLFVTEWFQDEHHELLKRREFSAVSQAEIEKAGTLQSNNAWIAILNMFDDENDALWDIVLVLDGINDPGNLGTIMRIADWYGITTIIASKDTVDCYNPKVIMASMGSYLRTRVQYTDIEKFLLSQKEWTIFGAYLGGENIHTLSSDSFREKTFLVIGSEAHGIRDGITSAIHRKITIPGFWNAESLNAWVATAVILDNFRRLIPLK